MRKRRQQTRRRPVLDVSSSSAKVVRRYTHYYGSEESSNNDVVRPHNLNDETTRSRIKRLPKVRAHSLPTYIAVVVIIASLFYSSIVGNRPLVIVAPDAGLHNKEYYENQANIIMSKSILNRSKLTFDTHAFAENFKNSNPEVRNVNVHIPLLGRRLVVGISFVKPAYTFRVNSKDYILGENGVIIANAGDVKSSWTDSLIKIEDKAPLDVTVGKTVLLGSDVDFVNTLIDELRSNGLELKSITLPQGAGELYVYLKNNSYFIKFSLVGDVRQQTGALFSVLRTMGNSIPTEYIDVRVGERVFVK